MFGSDTQPDTSFSDQTQASSFTRKKMLVDAFNQDRRTFTNDKSAMKRLTLEFNDVLEAYYMEAFRQVVNNGLPLGSQSRHQGRRAEEDALWDQSLNEQDAKTLGDIVEIGVILQAEDNWPLVLRAPSRVH